MRTSLPVLPLCAAPALAQDADIQKLLTDRQIYPPLAARCRRNCPYCGSSAPM